ncbi:DUF3558 family protein [Nocardia sp. IBHARD005]|uniref:DUF3558 family protein n=1 Tax=Nocardia sp. IBHARD005 TaxID=3457765 RepID=UPI00405882C5
MTRATVGLTALSTLVIAGALSGCTDQESPQTPAPKTPGPIAVQVAAPPTRDNPGRAPVTYDPCRSFDDDAVVRAGFTPRTRERADFVADKYSVVGCAFGDRETGHLTRSLTIDISNVPLREQPYFANALEHLTINGREAIIFRLSGSMEKGACFLAMSTTDGSASVHISESLEYSTGDPCGQIKEVAAVYEAELPA